MDRCEQCGTKIRRETFCSPLGRAMCAACHDKLVGVLVAMKNGDFGLAPAMAGNEPGKATGILAWIRRSLGRG